MSFDYRQIELRVAAHLSQDPKLAFVLQERGDIFSRMASVWLQVDLSQVTKEHRAQAKQICYGILYGAGPKSLAENMVIAVVIFYVLRFTFYVLRFTFYVLRFTFCVLRFTFYVLLFYVVMFYSLRFTVYVLQFTLCDYVYVLRLRFTFMFCILSV
jgi:hypothetical protein